MCGIVGIYTLSQNKGEKLYKKLKSLQHRGQDSYGYSNGDVIVKKMGLIESPSTEIDGNCIIGHTRYKTSGNIGLSESQPLKKNDITLVHNGNIEKYTGLTDTYYILEKLNDNLKDSDICDAIIKTVNEIDGAFFIIMIYKNHIYAFKDKHGIRPGGYWVEENKTIVASERTDGIYNDIYPGEIVVVGEQIKKICFAKYNITPCIFEYIYFAEKSSTIYGLNVEIFRKKLGSSSVSLLPSVDFDIVIGIPKTARVYAQEIASSLKIPYIELIRNKTERSFILPTQQERENYVKKKFSFPPSCFSKKVLVVDDSIVRGTISKHIVSELRKGGVEYICFLSCSPKIVKKNTYGINIVSEKELVSYNKSEEEICKNIGADKLVYQNIENLYKSSGFSNLELSIFV